MFYISCKFYLLRVSKVLVFVVIDSSQLCAVMSPIEFFHKGSQGGSIKHDGGVVIP